MTHASHNATNSHTTNEESTMSTNDPTKKLNSFVRAAHDYYMYHTKKTFEELRDYQRSDWGDGLTGDEWASAAEAAEAGIDSAQNYLSGEDECAERYRVANEFPALGDCMATYHATEADANEAAAGLIASLTDDIMAWGELTPVAPTGDAAEVAAMREAYDLAASASDDAINNAGIVRMTREAAELIAARAVSITRVNA